MKKIENITNILKFYMAVNKLKETTKGESSRADNVFGSSILAIAFNSEFNNASNLANIIKMELLYELSYTPDFFNVIKCMNAKKEIEELLLEFQACKSPDGNLAHKYKSLDVTLSSIAEDTKSIDEFVDKALVIISMDKDKEKYINILKFYYYNQTLKSKVRSGWNEEHWNIESENERIEMISDHIIGAVGLAFAFGSEFKYEIDINKVLKTLMIHEIGEAIIGDVTPFDNVSPEQKHEIEHMAMKQVLGNLNKCDELYQSLLDFDACINPIDKFSHYCDKLEADLQSKVYQEKGFHHSLDNQSNNIVMKSRIVQTMITSGLATTPFDIWFLYDKGIYEFDIDMQEFFSTLKCAKDNELLNLNKTIVETIDLSEQEYELLLSEISFEIARLKKNRWVEAITISFYQDEKRGIIIIKSACTEIDLENYFKELNSYFAAKNLTSIKVEFIYKLVVKRPSYFFMSNESNEEKQSTIVFDRNGLLNKKELVGFYDFDNQKNNYKVNYNPNIERELKLLQS